MPIKESTQKVFDYSDKEVKVGVKVRYYDNENPEPHNIGEVVAITDFDGDVDDDTGRSITIAPDVRVKYPDGTVESYTTNEWEFDPTSYDDEGTPMSYDATGKVEELVVIE